MTYSRPPSAKPPRPLKDSRSAICVAVVRPPAEPGAGVDGPVRPGRSRRLTCSARPPSRVRRTDRAAVWQDLRPGRRWTGLRWRAGVVPTGSFQADDLLSQAAPPAQQDGTSRRLEQRPLFDGEQVATQDVDATMSVRSLVGQGGLAGPDKGLERLLEVLGIRHPLLVHDDEVDGQELQVPVLVGAQQLSDDVQIIWTVDPDHDDRHIAGDASGPESGCPSFVACHHPRRRPQRWVRVDEPIGEPLEQVRLIGLDAQVMQLDLGLRPGQGQGPVEGGRFAVLVSQVQHRVP